MLIIDGYPAISAMATETDEIVSSMRQKARELLVSGKVGVVIGYGEGYTSDRVTPVFITNPEDTARLIFDSRCTYNLTTYLKKPAIRSMGRIGIVVKGCDAKAINVLMLEQQVKREDLFIFGIACESVGDPVRDKCITCNVHTPPVYDELFGKPITSVPWDSKSFTKLNDLESLSQEELFRFWTAQFDRCIKCYACREACPMCTCTRCITDKNQPQWVPSSAHSLGNFHWNLTRAFHLAGRCVGCEECEAACPMDIPLSLLNLKLIKAVFRDYGFIAGMNSQDKPPLATYTEGESQDFIK